MYIIFRYLQVDIYNDANAIKCKIPNLTISKNKVSKY